MSARDAILAAAAVPKGHTKIAGQKVAIRGLTSGEEQELLAEGLTKAAIPVCAVCIVGDDGKPMFTEAELRGFRGGTLKQPLLDILALTYPKEAKATKNS